LIGTAGMFGRVTASQIASGIRRVVFVALDERLHVLRRNQLYRVPQRLQLPRPVVRTAARFHANLARQQIGEEGHHLVTLELLLQHGRPPFVSAMYLEHVLRRIDTNRRKFHLGRSLSFKWSKFHRHFGTSMPFREGATIPLL
jgi:hypothetical protein